LGLDIDGLTYTFRRHLPRSKTARKTAQAS